jgi:[acyl-carrier-protein] S-malonyltransferase
VINSNREYINMNNTAFIFPGQGSQAIGMGKKLYDKYESARNIFDDADNILNFSLSRLCFEGPEEELIKTINVQPAIFVASMACFKVASGLFQNKLDNPAYVAGHSLGEYNALVIAGVLSFKDALLLIRERGRLMNEAGEKNPGGMLAIIGVSQEKVEDICARCGTGISNINCPGQIVISGSSELLHKARIVCEAEGIRRIIPLKVSGAFHSHLLVPASEGLNAIINNYTFNNASIPVVSNITAGSLINAEEIKNELVNQILKCVQWQKSVKNMIASGVDHFVEFGHGQVLTNLIKRIDQNVMLYNIGDDTIESQIESFHSSLNQ